jgi:MerR family Zn(II)-responsive transcriptional regulator of zntA
MCKVEALTLERSPGFRIPAWGEYLVLPSGERAHRLKIGELARLCDISQDALRFYERKGILHPLSRTPAGQRLYDEGAVQRIQLIRRHQAMGLTLDDIRELLRIHAVPDRDFSAEVSTLLRARIRAIEEQIETLRSFHLRLAAALTSVEGSRPDSFVPSLLESFDKLPSPNRGAHLTPRGDSQRASS